MHMYNYADSTDTNYCEANLEAAIKNLLITYV